MTPPDQPEKKDHIVDANKMVDANKTMGEGPFRVGRYYSKVDDNFFYGVFIGPFVGDQEDFDGVNLMSHCDGNTVESVVRAKCDAMNEFVLSWLSAKGWAAPEEAASLRQRDEFYNQFPANEIIDRLQKELSALKEMYHELIMVVGNKYPGETRHQTALRYIRQAEQPVNGPAKASRENG